MDVAQTIELLDELSKDMSMPRNIRSALCEIKVSLDCSAEQIPLRVDAALQKLEELAMDQNLPSFSRTALWDLTACLESFNR